MAEVAQSTYAYQQDIEKLCRSGWAKPKNGTCGKAVLSKNAVTQSLLNFQGNPCLSDLDCPTTDTTVYATCRCGFSTKGQKYCDI